ncbi:hypothetical protein BB560_004489 [Smittium megazygosporum]|uniref:Ras-GEF domain-containing protein n=1 Tax=Smittium megazygosporum TaxID=133381 RepID=A0A2T9Z987_9FUNG|nr:hypothetical protein BB560_004489 [Smittium megazygosporum]
MSSTLNNPESLKKSTILSNLKDTSSHLRDSPPLLNSVSSPKLASFRASQPQSSFKLKPKFSLNFDSIKLSFLSRKKRAATLDSAKKPSFPLRDTVTPKKSNQNPSNIPSDPQPLSSTLFSKKTSLLPEINSPTKINNNSSFPSTVDQPKNINLNTYNLPPSDSNKPLPAPNTQTQNDTSSTLKRNTYTLPKFWKLKYTLSGSIYFANVVTNVSTSSTFDIECFEKAMVSFLKKNTDGKNKQKAFLTSVILNLESKENLSKNINFIHFNPSKSDSPHSPINELSVLIGNDPDVNPDLSISPEILSASVTLAIYRLKLAIKNSEKNKFIETAESINSATFEIISTLQNQSASDPSKVSFFRAYQRQVITSGCDLLLSASIAAGIWPPPNASAKLLDNAKSLLAIVRKFLAQVEESRFLVPPSPTSLDNTPRSSTFSNRPTNLNLNTTGLNFFSILNKCPSLESFHSFSKKISFLETQSSQTKPSNPAADNLQYNQNLLRPYHKKSETAPSNVESPGGFKVNEMNIIENIVNGDHSTSDLFFSNIINLILYSFAKIEDESRNLAKSLIIFEHAVKKFARVSREISVILVSSNDYYSSTATNSTQPAPNQSEDIQKNDAYFTEFIECTKNVVSKSYSVILGISSFLKEISLVHQICIFCGLSDEDLIPISEALSSAKRNSASLFEPPTQSIFVESSDQYSNLSDSKLLKDFKEAQSIILYNSTDLISSVQSIAFVLPKIIYFNEILKKTSGLSSKHRPKIAEYNYELHSFNKSPPIFYTSIPVNFIDPKKYTFESNDAHKDKSNFVKNQEKSPLNIETHSNPVKNPIPTNTIKKHMKNIILPVENTQRGDHSSSAISYQTGYKNSLSDITTHLKKIISILSGLDDQCLNLSILAKLELDRCNQKIIKVFHQYLIQSRFLPPQSSNRRNTDTTADVVSKPLANANRNSENKFVPIVVNTNNNALQKTKTSPLITSTLNKVDAKHIIKPPEIKTRALKKSSIQGISSFSSQAFSYSNSLKMLRKSNRNSLKNFFTKSSNKRVSVISQAFSISDESSINSIFSHEPSPNLRTDIGSNSYVISGSSSQTWFFQSELSSESLVLSIDGTLRAASLPAMVERLTAHDVLDTKFISAFMLTYRSFTTTPRLLSLLFERYSISPPAGLRQNELQLWTERKLDPIHLRVFNIFRSWLREHFYPDVEGDTDALQMLNAFACTVMAESRPALAEKLIKLIEHKNRQIGYIHPTDKSAYDGSQSTSTKLGIKSSSRLESALDTLAFSEGSGSTQNLFPRNINIERLSMRRFANNFLSPIPSSIMPASTLSSSSSITSISPIELARQITIIDHNLLVLVRPIEFLKKAWSISTVDPSATNGLNVEIASNLRTISILSTRVSHFVTAKVLSEKSIGERVNMLVYFIDLAEQLWVINNFNSLVNVLGGIQSAPIQRLKQTWELLPTKSLESYHSLKGVMNTSRNYILYREAIQKASPPSIPYIGLALTDLTFIEDGNSDYYGDSKELINFSKYSQIADIIKQIQVFQDVPYPFVQINEIISFLFNSLQSSIPNTFYSENLIDIFLKTSNEIEPST